MRRHWPSGRCRMLVAEGVACFARRPHTGGGAGKGPRYRRQPIGLLRIGARCPIDDRARRGRQGLQHAAGEGPDRTDFEDAQRPPGAASRKRSRGARRTTGRSPSARRRGLQQMLDHRRRAGGTTPARWRGCAAGGRERWRGAPARPPDPAHQPAAGARFQRRRAARSPASSHHSPSLSTAPPRLSRDRSRHSASPLEAAATSSRSTSSRTEKGSPVAASSPSNREPRGADQGFYQRALLAALGSGGAPGGKPRRTTPASSRTAGAASSASGAGTRSTWNMCSGGAAAAQLDLAEPAILQRRDDFAGVVVEPNIRRRRSDPDPRQP